MQLTQLDGQNKNELSLVEVAYAYLEETNQVADFNQLLEVVQEYLGLSDEMLSRRMTDFYTDLNVDGSFINLGENRWGLRYWYPIDAIDEEIVGTLDEEDIKEKHRKTRKLSAFGEDVIDYSDDDPEDQEIADEEEELDIVDDEDDDEEEDEDISNYKEDLDQLGDNEDDELVDDLEDGLEGELVEISEDDEEEEDEDLF